MIYATSYFNNDCAGILTNTIFDHQMICLWRYVNLKRNKGNIQNTKNYDDNNKLEDTQ